MANNKKYISLNRLSNFLDNLRNTFALLSHKHTVADLTDYTVDSALSSTSTNPVQNSVLNEEFESIATAMNALDLAIDGKADASHDHNDVYYTETEIDAKLSDKADSSHSHAISEVTNLQSSLDGKVPTSRTINNKPLSENVTLSASDIGAAPSSHSHNDIYYTETEIDAKLELKSDTSHNHDSAYYSKSDGEELANTLADVKEDVDAFFKDATISTAAKDTLKEIQDYIDSDVSAAAEMTASIANKADKSHTHKVADITDITATATELNYMDGVTSNVQTQLDTKSDAIHNHPYGVCSSSATYTTKTVTVDNFSLVEGARVIVKFTNANSASSPKLNVNGTGAIPIMRYGTTAVGSNSATNGWEAGAVLAFTYDGTNWVQDYWYNTTYTNIELGQGFGYCYTSSSVADKEVTMSNYEAKTGGIVSVKFSYSVDAGEVTMNINGKGAKTVNYMGSDMIDDVIKGGDIATFIYTGSTYHLISVDRWFEDITELQANDSRVRQMPTTTNGNFRLLLTPSFQSEEATAYTYFNSNLYANPYYNKIYADISGTSTGVKGVTAGNFLVGNGSDKMTEKTPAEVLSMINGASVRSMTTAEYNALGANEINANTLYMLTDGEQEVSTQVQIITWGADD